MQPHGLDTDPRTAWAYYKYRAAGHPVIPEAAAAALLSTLDEDEHAEVIAPAAGGYEHEFRLLDDPYESGNELTAIRTITRWVCSSPTGDIVSITGPIRGGISRGSSQNDKRQGRDCLVTILRLGGSRWTLAILAGADSELLRTLKTGAGNVIKRLPAQRGVPSMPDLDATPQVTGTEKSRPDLPTDWVTTEDLAAVHLRTLGFDDARRTGGGRDGGIDVIATGVVAQVKMQALPVSAPVVQQLRGARPDAGRWAFYSTSGYTAPALDTGTILGVAMFGISRTGEVTAANHIAMELETMGRDSTSGPWSIARRYAFEVTERVRKHVADHSEFNPLTVRGHQVGLWSRSARYLDQAWDDVRSAATFTTPRAMVVYYHHADLLAAVGARYLTALSGTNTEVQDPSLEDFYQ